MDILVFAIFLLAGSILAAPFLRLAIGVKLGMRDLANKKELIELEATRKREHEQMEQAWAAKEWNRHQVAEYEMRAIQARLQVAEATRDTAMTQACIASMAEMQAKYAGDPNIHVMLDIQRTGPGGRS